MKTVTTSVIVDAAAGTVIVVGGSVTISVSVRISVVVAATREIEAADCEASAVGSGVFGG